MSVTELLLRQSESYRHVGFHAQQAVEKALKAVLVRRQVPFAKTHDLNRLRGLLPQTDQPLAQRLAPADILTPFGVELRYPGGQRPHGDEVDAPCGPGRGAGR